MIRNCIIDTDFISNSLIDNSVFEDNTNILLNLEKDLSHTTSSPIFHNSSKDVFDMFMNEYNQCNNTVLKRYINRPSTFSKEVYTIWDEAKFRIRENKNDVIVGLWNWAYKKDIIKEKDTDLYIKWKSFAGNYMLEMKWNVFIRWFLMMCGYVEQEGL